MSAISLSSLVAQATPATPTTTSGSTFWQKYISERRPEVQQLKDALQTGDIAAAQQDYKNLVALGNNVLGKDNPFTRSDRALDFNAIGGALQNGDLAGAQQAFAALENTFKAPPPVASSSSVPTSVTSASDHEDGASAVNVVA
jgi:hypothetical protein